MVDETRRHQLAVEIAQARERPPVTGALCRIRNERDAARRERDEARSFAQGVYRWGPRAQIPAWEAALPWLKGGEPVDMAPFEDVGRGRLVLLEATVKIIHKDLTRLMAALEGLEEAT